MAALFPEMLSSPHFTFLIGENREPVVAHAKVMSNLSKPFDRLINGPMIEAQENSATMPHVEKAIFLRLVEFAYRGDYTVGHCPDVSQASENKETLEEDEKEIKDEDGDEEEDEDGNEEGEDDNFSLNSEELDALEVEEDDELADEVEEEEENLLATLKENAAILLWDVVEESRNAKISNLSERFVAKTHLPLQNRHSHETLAMDYSKKHLGASDRDHKGVFLLNAKMYCLADYHIVPALQKLALHKLHEALKWCVDPEFLQTRQRVEDIIELAAYAYSNDNTQDTVAGRTRDALRQEVLDYIFVHIDSLQTAPAFQELMVGNGRLSADLVFQFSKERQGDLGHPEAVVRYYSGRHLAYAWALMGEE